MWTAISAAISLYFAKYKSQFLIAGVALLAVVGVCLFAYFDIKSKEATAAQIAVQQLQMNELKARTEVIERDQAAVIKNSQQMIKNLTAIREDIAKRQKTIQTHDLAKIGAAHPNMLQDRINKATRAQNHRFEEITKP